MKFAKDWDQPESCPRKLEESRGSCDGVSVGKLHGMASGFRNGDTYTLHEFFI
jgi:hypothetical protein